MDFSCGWGGGVLQWKMGVGKSGGWTAEEGEYSSNGEIRPKRGAEKESKRERRKRGRGE